MATRATGSQSSSPDMLVRNVTVGVFGSLWSAALGFAVVPFYLKYLGIEAYGLIGFFATAQAIFQLLDLGMAPTINREIAKRNVNGVIDAAPLLHTLSVVYWAMAATIAVIAIGVSSLIASE